MPFLGGKIFGTKLSGVTPAVVSERIGGARKHDILLFYTKSKNYSFNMQYRPYSEGTLQRGLTQYKKNLNENYELRAEGAAGERLVGRDAANSQPDIKGTIWLSDAKAYRTVPTHN